MNPEQSAGVVAPPPLIFVSGLAAGFAAQAKLPSVTVRSRARVPLGAGLIVTGLAFSGTFLASFSRAKTPVEPWKATKAIVTTGPYKVTRNPAYLGMALAYSGIAIAAGAAWPFATLLPTLAVIDQGVIAREERYLEREFGEEYLAYKRRVRRWI